ncbi:MAG: uroporphyrinogen III methyltransferase [Porticoccaceae bacterium]|nr:MAG: uroporphyrinogen III methyltransferase [Porticoccaceae bacterium]
MATERPLAGLGVLLVRAARAPDRFAEGLEAAGARVYRHPVLAIRPLPPAGSLARRLARADLLIFTSRNAAELALARLAAEGETLPPVPLAAVGPETAAPLAESGRAVAVPARRDSEGLLALPELAAVRGRRVLILAGEGGRELLREALRERGAEVEKLALYRREADRSQGAAIAARLARGEVEAVALHSGETLDALLACLDPPDRRRLTALAALVPGRRVAELARRRGFARLVVAESALAEAMVEALCDWYTSRRAGSGGGSNGRGEPKLP